MKNLKKLSWIFVALFCLTFTACKDDKNDATPVDENAWKIAQDTASKLYVITGNLTSGNVTLDSSKKYLLKNYVRIADGATLTIQPGTVIKGDFATKGTLIIQRGAKIMAVGTQTKPIIFTSNAAKGTRGPSNWGGVVIAGKAPINATGGEAEFEGGYGEKFGGTDAADNSGVLKYVRIEFGGVALLPNQEINGLTMGGVGSGTELDYIQVSYSGDDSFEWFGGTVNAKHLIAFRGLDDDFDTDFGYSGKIQYGVVLRDPANADQSGSNGFESDNDPTGTDASPKTAPQFSNISVFGPLKTSGTVYDPNFKRGAHIRRNSAMSVYNSVISGFPFGILIDDAKSEGNATSDALKIRNTTLAACTTPLAVNSGRTWDIASWYATVNYGNSILATNADLMMAGDPFALTAPNFQPSAGSPLLGSASFSGITGFETVTYRGAFDGTNNWTTGWTNFDPQNANY
ncbi:MAG: T9SS C-terminal target domain-containing protein [Bacteroidota bacterium]